MLTQVEAHEVEVAEHSDEGARCARTAWNESKVLHLKFVLKDQDVWLGDEVSAEPTSPDPVTRLEFQNSGS